MTLVQKIRYLCAKRKINLATLEREIGLANSTIRRWDERVPSVDRVSKVADYFHVSVDYLLGKTDDPTPADEKRPYYALNEKDERDIAKKLDEMMEELTSGHSISFLGEPIDEEDLELLRISLENTIRISKELAKKKFTPKKYRK